jgi:hypothetical protein
MPKAYTYDLKSKSVDHYQSSPTWLCTFIRWTNRDTLNFASASGPETKLSTRDVMCVKNDCIAFSISGNKSSPSQQIQLTLKSPTIDYSAAIGTGDFLCFNILGSEKEIDEVEKLAKQLKPINDFKQGFKGLYKVHSVTKKISIQPESGTKFVVYQISAFSFTELNNKLYFQPLLTQLDANNQGLYLARLGTEAARLNFTKNGRNAQDIIKTFIDSTLGNKSFSTNYSGDKDDISPNTQFYIPSSVGNLLGIEPKGSNFTVKDIMSYIYGIQKYDSQTFLPTPNLEPIQGTFLVQVDYFNQTPLWSVLNQYLNSPINEMYTCFRTNADNQVVPHVIVRQTPYSSPKYTGKLATQFLTLPRWRISADRLLDLSVAKDEALRTNFVQIFGQIPGISGIAQQQAQGNYQLDIEDIKKHGLRPLVFTTNGDSLVGENKGIFQSIEWTKLIADILIGGHMRLSGQITATGIYEPITHGDNFQLENTVFHIEGVTHAGGIDNSGDKSFYTTLILSHGVIDTSETDAIEYPNNNNKSLNDLERDSYQESRLLPSSSGDGSLDSSPQFDFNLPNEKQRFNKTENRKPKNKDKKK